MNSLETYDSIYPSAAAATIWKLSQLPQAWGPEPKLIKLRTIHINDMAGPFI